jgi:nitrogen fixation/metabolism regulation signal transduction histidine kinase
VSEFIVIYRQVQVLNAEGKPEVDSNGDVLTTTEPQPPINPIQLILPPILINNVIIVIIISILGIFYSHKIAGPAYRMSMDINRVLDGEKGVQIKLRQHDKLHNLADRVNQLIAEYDKVRK